MTMSPTCAGIPMWIASSGAKAKKSFTSGWPVRKKGRHGDTYRDCVISIRKAMPTWITERHVSAISTSLRRPKQAVSSTGANHSCNWRQPAAASIPARSVSAGERSLYAYCPSNPLPKDWTVSAQHGIRDVRILDRTFNYNASRARALLELFRSYHPALHFHLEIHPALLTEELKSLLAGMPAGLLHLEAGIQSLHEDVLEAL